MQKYKIDFKLRDLSEMLNLIWTMKDEEVPLGDEERVVEDEDGPFDISTKLNYDQFYELYKTIRSKKWMSDLVGCKYQIIVT